MSSQLNVDTIVDKAGSGGTNVKIANTSVSVTEGGSGTTNTVQGLSKAHCHWDSNSTIVTGFNISSIDDDGLGDWDLNYTNNFGGTDNIISTAADNSFQSSNVCYNTVGGNTAADTTIFGIITTGGNKDVSTYVTVDGDLA
jgi:hypothetical protein